MTATMTIPRHPVCRASRKRMKFKEMPQRAHDELVREYWKTWIAATGLCCRDKDAFLVFVGEMESRLYDAAEAGLFTTVDGITKEGEDD